MERASARLALLLACVLILVSRPLPYWTTVLQAPQYPDGLHYTLYVGRSSGDVDEIDELNHYIGMEHIEELALWEQHVWPAALLAVAASAAAGAALGGPWGTLVALPALLYPAGFSADLFRWQYAAGHSLDPHAPLSSSVQPFTPPLVGSRQVAQFQVSAAFGTGFYLALLAAALVVAAGWLRWRGGRT